MKKRARRRGSIIIPLIILSLVLCFFPLVKRAVLGLLVLEALANLEEEPFFAKLTRDPLIEEVEFQGRERIIEADLYRPADEEKHSAVLLNHGVVDTGKKDFRLVSLAKTLARAGFVVLVPAFERMKEFKVGPKDIEEIVESFQYLLTLPCTLPQKAGMIGFSYGAGPTLLAATRPEIKSKVKFLVSFGGYYDLKNVIKFITTGYYEHQGYIEYQRPQEYGKEVFLLSNLDLLENENDREILKNIFARTVYARENRFDSLVKKLTPGGKGVFDLLTNKDPSQVEELLANLNPKIKRYIAELSPEGALRDLEAYLLIAHGNPDQLIPYTESLKLVEAIEDKKKVHLAILDIYTHVDPGRLELKNILPYFKGKIKIYFLICDLLRQQT